MNHSDLRCCLEMIIRHHPERMREIRSSCRAGREAASSCGPEVSMGAVRRMALERFSEDPWHLILNYPRDPRYTRVLREIWENRSHVRSNKNLWMVRDSCSDWKSLMKYRPPDEKPYRGWVELGGMDVFRYITFPFDVIRAKMELGKTVNVQFNLRAGCRFYPFGDPMRPHPIFLSGLNESPRIELLMKTPAPEGCIPEVEYYNVQPEYRYRKLIEYSQSPNANLGVDEGYRKTRWLVGKSRK